MLVQPNDGYREVFVMRKRAVSISKRLAIAVFLALLLTGTLFGQEAGNKSPLPAPVNDQRVLLGDDHQHGWDDLRLLLITIVEVNGHEVRWKHQTPFETKTGLWQVGKMLTKSEKGLKSDRIHSGKEFVAVYCSHCQTVIWLYDSR
jgi:hypothetical protein